MISQHFKTMHYKGLMAVELDTKYYSNANTELLS